MDSIPLYPLPLEPGVDCAFEYIQPSLSSLSSSSSSFSFSKEPSVVSSPFVIASPLTKRSFLVHNYDWIGFDLDHALARYHVQALMRTIYATLSKALVEQCTYSRAIFRHRRPFSSTPGSTGSSSSSPTMVIHRRKTVTTPSSRTGFDPYPGEPSWINDWCIDSYDPSFLHKGLIFDFRTGDLLKIDMYGHIIMVYHGLYPLSTEQIRQRYGITEDGYNGIWSDFHLLRDQKRHESAFVLITYFDLPAQLTLVQCVQAIDELYCTGSYDTGDKVSLSSFNPSDTVTPSFILPDRDQCGTRYLHLQKDHITAFNYIFDNVEAWDSNRGGFFEAIKKSPGTYYIPRPRLAEHLRNLRMNHGKHIFLATNSHLQFATHALEFILGSEWRTCFDIVIFNSVKPAFFGRITPFHHPDSLRRSDGTITDNVSIHVPYFPSENSSVEFASTTILKNLPLPPEFCQGNATTIQAIADATKWLKNRGYQYLYPSHIMNKDNESLDIIDTTTTTKKKNKEPFLLTRLTAHVDDKGHVIKVTAKHTPSSSNNQEGTIVPNGIPIREIVIPLPRSVHKGGLAHTNNNNEDMSGTLTGKPAHIAAKLPPQNDNGTDTVVQASPHTHTHPTDNHIPVAKHEPSVIASLLLDELSNPLDNETGQPLEIGGAEGAHPGHARILYIGDHMHGDIVAAVRECEWDTVAIVEEIELSVPLQYPTNDAADTAVQYSHQQLVPIQIQKGKNDTINPKNWENEYKLLSPWGSFWTSGYDIMLNIRNSNFAAERLNSMDHNNTTTIDTFALRRSWFCALLQANARIVVSDADMLIHM